MENLERPEEEWQDFFVLPRNLVSIGIRSAVKSLEILSDDEILLGKITRSMKHYLVQIEVLIKYIRDFPPFRP